MQGLTLEQGDVVLDIVKQCWLVSTYYEEKKAARDQDATYDNRFYVGALNYLTDLYVQATRIGIEDEVLRGILNRNLANDIEINIKVPEGT